MPPAPKVPRRQRLEPARRDITRQLTDLAGQHDLTHQDVLELLVEQQLVLAGRLQQTSVRRGS